MQQQNAIIVAFAGPSGSGKSELVKGLLQAYPMHCIKWKQVTTRDRRGPDDDYVFINEDQYDTMSPVLTCKTTFNGCRYGTIAERLVVGTAMLTIVDANGIADLEQDVAEHNASLTERKSGRFGEHPVRLIKVALIYDVSDQEEISHRGRQARGQEFIAKELDTLSDLAFDHFIDTTGRNWPDATAFFNEQVWPRLHEVVAPTKTNLEQLAELLSGEALSLSVWQSEKAEILAQSLLGVLREPREVATTAFVDEAIAAASEDLAVTTEAINDTPQHPEPASTAEPAPEAAPEEPIIQATPDTESPRYVPLRDVFANHSFEDWHLSTGGGLEAFETVESFAIVMRQFVTCFNGNASGISVDATVNKDDRGGDVVVFTVHGSGLMEQFFFSRRLRRLLATVPSAV